MDRWKKVPGMQKWIGYYAGKHAATIMVDPLGHGHTRCWIDTGLGFQEVVEIIGEQPVGIKQWKMFANYAYKTTVTRLQTNIQVNNP